MRMYVSLSASHLIYIYLFFILVRLALPISKDSVILTGESFLLHWRFFICGLFPSKGRFSDGTFSAMTLDGQARCSGIIELSG